MGNTMTGNRALFKINGSIVGFAGITQNVTVSDDYGLQRVSGIGSSEAVELVPGEFIHTITVSKYFFSGETLEQLGYAPDAENLLSALTFDLEIQDTLSGATLEHYEGCQISTTSRSYAKHVISGEEATIFALRKIK